MSITKTAYVEKRRLNADKEPVGDWIYVAEQPITSVELKYIFKMPGFDSEPPISNIKWEKMAVGTQAQLPIPEDFDYRTYSVLSLNQLDEYIRLLRRLITTTISNTALAMGLNFSIDQDFDLLYVNEDEDRGTLSTPSLPISKRAIESVFNEVLNLYKAGQLDMLWRIGDQYSIEFKDDEWTHYEVRFIIVTE